MGTDVRADDVVGTLVEATDTKEKQTNKQKTRLGKDGGKGDSPAKAGPSWDLKTIFVFEFELRVGRSFLSWGKTRTTPCPFLWGT